MIDKNLRFRTLIIWDISLRYLFESFSQVENPFGIDLFDQFKSPFFFELDLSVEFKFAEEMGRQIVSK